MGVLCVIKQHWGVRLTLAYQLAEVWINHLPPFGCKWLWPYRPLPYGGEWCGLSIMAPTTHSNTLSGVTVPQMVVAVDDVLGCLSHRRRKLAKDDLVKVVCDYYHHNVIRKTLQTTFRMLPEQPGGDDPCWRPGSTVRDIPADAVLPIVCRDTSNIPQCLWTAWTGWLHTPCVPR